MDPTQILAGADGNGSCARLFSRWGSSGCLISAMRLLVALLALPACIAIGQPEPARLFEVSIYSIATVSLAAEYQCVIREATSDYIGDPTASVVLHRSITHFAYARGRIFPLLPLPPQFANGYDPFPPTEFGLRVSRSFTATSRPR